MRRQINSLLISVMVKIINGEVVRGRTSVGAVPQLPLLYQELF